RKYLTGEPVHMSGPNAQHDDAFNAAVQAIMTLLEQEKDEGEPSPNLGLQILEAILSDLEQFANHESYEVYDRSSGSVQASARPALTPKSGLTWKSTPGMQPISAEPSGLI